MEQLTIDLSPSITSAYRTCVEYVSARVHQQNKQQKAIAADMDLSPSHLSQKLGPKENSSSRFTLDDLELYTSVTGDLEPIKYLTIKYLCRQPTDEIAQLVQEMTPAQREALKKQLEAA